MAYLDAGTGSMMLQAVLGGAAGLAVMGRVFRARLARIFLFWRRPESLPSSEVRRQSCRQPRHSRNRARRAPEREEHGPPC